MTITTLQGDNTILIPTLPEKSIQMVCTSPPYFGLRDYGIAPTDWPAIEYTPMAGLDPITIPAMSCCLGLESTPAAYIGHLVHVWRLLWNVLREDGTCWLNIGDSYAGSGKGYGGKDHGKLGPHANEFLPPPSKNDGKPKDLLGIPWRAAFALQADGYYLRSDIVWHKPNAMPESVTDRPTKAHEYIFLLAKQERYYYDAAAIAEAASESSGWARQRAKGENTWKYNNTEERIAQTGQRIEASTFGTLGQRNRRTVWSVSTQPFSGAHFAVMPEALIEPCIKAGSAAQACEVCASPWERVTERESDVVNLEEGKRQAVRSAGAQTGGTQKVTLGVTEHVRRRDLGFRPTCAHANTGSARSIVLDPYCGTGTVMRVAERFGRDSIGIDLGYADLQAQRTNGVQVHMEALL